ncbi:MAG: hypothetical protein GKS06_10500 [Acidobacteria bacterium]|nr:hypothetical protein [Acidobacteriota bacterium]
MSVVADVRGGPDVAWIGFGVGPGASPDRTTQVAGVRALDQNGVALPIEAAGHAGYRITTNGEPWQLTYELALDQAATADTFYRGSAQGNDYIVLVGSDAWPRLYDDPTPLTMAPDNRPAGVVAQATVRFYLPESNRDWTIATTAWSEGERVFAMREHPVASVFALGPFTIDELPNAPRLQIARHRDWDLLADDIEPLMATLVESHTSSLGPASQRRALAVLSPLPDRLPIRGGLRTAGMVRDQTLLVYAARSPGVDPKHPGIAEAMAVFLGHELFHLWVPSAVQVTRELSWLSEGWAMHMGRRAAVAAGHIDEDDREEHLSAAYRRYLDIGGYRAGSLPAASLGREDQRNLLYLRGELIFRLLEIEWNGIDSDKSFERALWRSLTTAYDGFEPLDARAIRQILVRLTDEVTVRRYVEGQAPLTPETLGLAGQ